MIRRLFIRCALMIVWVGRLPGRAGETLADFLNHPDRYE